MSATYVAEIEALWVDSIRCRREYYARPHSGIEWCVSCVQPVGTNRGCENCKATARMRRHRRNA